MRVLHYTVKDFLNLDFGAKNIDFPNRTIGSNGEVNGDFASLRRELLRAFVTEIAIFDG